MSNGTSRFLLAMALTLGAGLTLAAGVYLQHYFVVATFATWIGFEVWLRRSTSLAVVQTGFRFSPLARLLTLYGKNDTVSERVLEQLTQRFKAEQSVSEFEERWLMRLRDLLELRGLVFGKLEQNRRVLRQGYAYSVREERGPLEKPENNQRPWTLSDITDASMWVAGLYWKLYDTALSQYPELALRAKELYSEIFGREFEANDSRERIEKLTEAMQRDGGVPFLILNWLRLGQFELARFTAQALLANDADMDPDARSTAYWLSELHWFTKSESAVIADYDSTMRHIYHLCFTNPERGGFLEIDSQFFSQFDLVNELAREGFLFKETLIEKTLEVWGTFDGYFNGVFRGLMENLLDQTNKIYDDRDSWAMVWGRVQNEMSRDYLYLVEGNLAYAAGNYRDAASLYEKALKLNPKMRPALLNRVFAYTKLGDFARLEATIKVAINEKSLLPASLYVAGNAWLLAKNEEESDVYYSKLQLIEGWRLKADYYRSTFCFENGLFEEALRFAKRAHRANSTDTAVAFHLSLCHNKVGDKQRALELLSEMEETPEWLSYYRFTLERDTGRHGEASRTLKQIPIAYFEDAEELESALEFARQTKDLSLLRHLRQK